MKFSLAGLGVLLIGLVIFAATGEQSGPVPTQDVPVENITRQNVPLANAAATPVIEALEDNKAVAQPQIQNASNSSTRIAEWNALEFQNGLTVTDCLQCDEDIAVMLTCTNNSGTLAAQIPWLAFEKANPGTRAKVTLTIDNLAYVRVATLKDVPLVGHVPEILLYTDDPILEQIASGSELSFFMMAEKQTTSNGPVPLNGSRKAITKIAEICGTPNRGAQN